MTIKSQNRYDDSFKLQVLSDYYQCGQSAIQTARRWGVSSSQLLAWARLWPVDSESLSLPEETISSFLMGGKYKGKSREEIFRERISALEKSLAMERLRNRALEKLIETAEREEGVSIKKGGVRQ